MLVDQHGEMVMPVMKFLKYKDSTGIARNALLSYTDVEIDELVEFIRLLQNPFKDVKVTGIRKASQKRKARSINVYLDKVYAFYDYIIRHEDYSMNLSERLKRQV